VLCYRSSCHSVCHLAIVFKIYGNRTPASAVEVDDNGSTPDQDRMHDVSRLFRFRIISHVNLFSDGSSLEVGAYAVNQYRVCSYVNAGFLYEQGLWCRLMVALISTTLSVIVLRLHWCFNSIFYTFCIILGLCVVSRCFCRMLRNSSLPTPLPENGNNFTFLNCVFFFKYERLEFGDRVILSVVYRRFRFQIVLFSPVGK
jgi:hypothetical protein